ncbi:MAG: hypothetical protein IJF84_13155 [Thermoguttaceae bacterium]|nr:hypothetical protein [Thermoguttaceae bacterium]
MNRMAPMLVDSRHLMVLVTNKYRRSSDNELVVVAAIMTYDNNTRNQSDYCVLYPNCGHPFIKHYSYVSYISLKEIAIDTLDKWKERNYIKQKERFNEDVQKQLLQGLCKADDAENRLKLIALNQLEELGWEVP